MVKSGGYVPDQRHLFWLTFDPSAGQEKAGRRPALVLSPFIYNHKSGLALCCPITSRVKGYPFEVGLPSGPPVSGVILVDHLKSLDRSVRKIEYVALLPQTVMDEVGAKLKTILPARS